MEQSTDENFGSYTVAATITDSGSTATTINGLSPSTSYYFRIKAYNDVGNSGYSNITDANTSLAAPTSLEASMVSCNTINLTWTSGSPGETGFKIEQSTDGEGFAEVATAWESGFDVTNLAPGTTYYFRVRAYNSDGNSGYSNTDDATTAAATTAPASPTALSAQAVSGAAAIDLEWQSNSGNECGFKIEQSTDGINFTEIGTTLPDCTNWTVAGLLPTTHYYFRVRAYNNYNGTSYSTYTTDDAWTASVAVSPTVATAAAATLNSAETIATLSVLGADGNADESALTYTWAATMLPPDAVAPTFDANETNAAKNTTVTFYTAGTYWLTATLTDATGLSTSSSIAVTVHQVAQSISISPTSISLDAGETHQFAATGEDQFGDALAAAMFTWSATSGTIDSAGLYTAPNATTTAAVTVHLGSLNASTNTNGITVTNHSPTVGTAATAEQVPATATIALSALGADADPTGEANLTYTWTAIALPSGGTATFDSMNGSNEGKDAVATVDKLGHYEFRVTISDGNSTPVTSSVQIDVVQTLTTITVSPALPTINIGEQQQFSAVGYDQFGAAMTVQPTMAWSATAGTIDNDGVYSPPRVARPITVIANSGSVVCTASVTATDPSPTTSPRLGDGWLESYWEISLGDPQTAGLLHYNQAAGNVLPTLVGDGTFTFTVAPTSTFSLANPHTYSTTTTPTTPSPTTTTWEYDCVTYTAVETDTPTLLIQEVLNQDGSWSYLEEYTVSYLIATTANGNAFSSVSGSYSYTFSASGTSTASTYACVVNVDTPAVSPTGDDSWSQTISSTDTIVNATDTVANTRTGSRASNGSALWSCATATDSDSTGSGGNSYQSSTNYAWNPADNKWNIASATASTTSTDDESAIVTVTEPCSDSGAGWSCSGTYLENSSDIAHASYTVTYAYSAVDELWHVVGGVGISHGNGTDTESCVTNGSYWPSASGDTTSGVYTDSNVQTTEYNYDVQVTLQNGRWTESGTGWVKESGSAGYTYDGSGPFSNGFGIGVQNEGGHQNDSYDAIIHYQRSSGNWTPIDGNAEEFDDWSKQFGYTVGNSGTDGDTSEFAEEIRTGSNERHYTLNLSQLNWTLTGGHAELSGQGELRDSWSHTGIYSASGGGWSVAGSSTSEQIADQSYQFAAYGNYSSGSWTYGGSGTISSSGSASRSYSGTGPYSGGFGTGTAQASGSDASFYNYTTNYNMNSSGAWVVDSIHNESSGNGFTDWSYSVSGSYTDGGYNWSASGSQAAGGGNTTDYDYLTIADYIDGDWTYDGHTSQSYGTTTNSSYSATGSYAHGIFGGTMSGAVDENGQSSSKLTYGSYSTLGSNGNWSDSTVTKTSKGNSDDHWSYSGSGSYAFDWVVGTIEEGGSDNRSGEYNATWTQDANGMWSSSGSGTTSYANTSHYSYFGSGSSTSGVNSFSAGDSGDGSFSSEHSESWVPAGGGWSQVGVSDHALGNHTAIYDFHWDWETEDSWAAGDFHRDVNAQYNLGRTNGVDSSSEVTVSHGSVDENGDIVNYGAGASYDYYGLGGAGCREESVTNYYADGTTSSSYSCTNEIKGVYFDVVYFDLATIDRPGFGSTCCDSGFETWPYQPAAPMAGYGGGLSHSFDVVEPPVTLVNVRASGEGDGLCAVSLGNATSLDSQMLSAATPNALFQFSHAGGPSFDSYLAPTTSNSTYDAAGRLTSLTDANFGVTRFTYDATGNLASLTDPVGNATSWLYDSANRMTQETDALGASRYFTYDNVGNLSRYMDRSGQIRQYGYDSAGNVSSETWYANSTDADTQQNAENTVDYTEESSGRITSESDNNTSDTYTYNDAGQIINTTQSTVGGPTVVLTYQYNPAGGRTQMAATIDGTADFVADYGYDSLGRVITVHQHGVDGGNAVTDVEVALAYNDNGQIVSIDRYEDGQLAVEGDYSYDSLGRLVGLVYHQGNTILNTYAWTYSGDSGVASGQWSVASDGTWLPTGGLMPIDDTTGVTDALMSGGLAGIDLLTSCTSNDGTANYSYDPTGQLLLATYTGDQADESYSYDANGNRVTANGSTYVTGAANRLLSDGTYTYSYDAEGNRLARWVDADADGVLDTGDNDIAEYAWDARDRLVEVTNLATFGDDPTQIVNYLYDVENRWVGENIDSNGDGVVDRQIRFAYDGNQIVLEFEKDGDGAVTGADLSHRYLWQPDAVDQLMADEQVSALSQPGEVVLPLADNLGTIRDLAVCDNGVTSIANHRVYDSFGNLKSQTNAAVDCLFGFTGLPFAKASGLNMSQTRAYDPSTGSWLTDDYISFDGSDANLYRYCDNSPTNATDPSGEALLLRNQLKRLFKVPLNLIADGIVTVVNAAIAAKLSNGEAPSELEVDVPVGYAFGMPIIVKATVSNIEWVVLTPTAWDLDISAELGTAKVDIPLLTKLVQEALSDPKKLVQTLDAFFGAVEGLATRLRDRVQGKKAPTVSLVLGNITFNVMAGGDTGDKKPAKLATIGINIDKNGVPHTFVHITANLTERAKAFADRITDIASKTPLTNLKSLLQDAKNTTLGTLLKKLASITKLSANVTGHLHYDGSKTA